MPRSDHFGFFLLFFLYSWRPAEGLCNLENGTIARCHYLQDARYINTYDLQTLKTSVAGKVLDPDAFKNLTSLRNLDLSGGNLEEIQSDSFLYLPYLHSLNLTKNQIKHLNPSFVESLKHLNYLSLRENHLHHLPHSLLQLRNLKTLDITGNPLECNCATMRVLDKLLERGVKIPKKVLCSSGTKVKEWSLLKPTSKLICIFEEENKDMQIDQPKTENSADEASFVKSVKDEEKHMRKDIGTEEIREGFEGLVSNTPKAETPVSEETRSGILTAGTSVLEENQKSIKLSSELEKSVIPASAVVVPLKKKRLKGDEGLFFDTDDRSSTASLSITPTGDPVKNRDSVEGSGSDDGFEGSGIVPPINFGESENENVFENVGSDEESNGGSLFDHLWDSLGSFKSKNDVESQKELEIEKEQFIKVPSLRDSMVEKQQTKAPEVSVEPQKEYIDNKEKNDTISRTDEVKPEVTGASSQDTRIGNGSLIVLIVLLIICIILVLLAIYKGDFFKKKRVPEDIEIGTEMKEMRKSLLDGVNSIQPKVAFNGTSENAPLMHVPLHPESKEEKSQNGNGSARVDTLSVVGTDHPSGELVKPPRKFVIQDEADRPTTNGKSHQDTNVDTDADTRTARNSNTDHVSPPLSPNTQRVKIVLQENPDSVPKTPLLITRTKIGENILET